MQFHANTLKALASARSNAAQRDMLTYSDLPGHSLLTLANKTDHLRFLTSTPNDHAARAAGDPKMRFVIIDPQDKLTIVHSTAPWCDATKVDMLIGVLGDSLSESSRVTLDRDALDKVTIAVGSDADIKSLNLKTLEREVIDCRNVGAPEDNTKITAADLGYEGTAYGNAPAFTVIPTTYPLAPEEKFCLEGHDIKQPIPPGVEADVHPGLTAWFKLVHKTKATNNTPCNGTGGSLFDPAEVITFEPETPSNPDSPNEPSEIIDHLGSRLVTSFHTNVTSISPRHEGAKATTERIDAAIMAKFEHFEASIPSTPVDPPIHGLNQARPASALTIQDITQVAQATAQTIMLTNKMGITASSTSSVEKNLLRYQVLFGHSETVENGDNTMTLATLSPRFIAVMKESNKAERHKALREDIELYQTTMVNSGGWCSTINFDNNILTDAMCIQLTGHNWLLKNMETTTGPLDTSITLFNFKPADTSSAYWNTLVDIQHSITGEELHEPDIKKHKKKPKQIYMQGLMSTRDHLVTTLANFLMMIGYMILDPEKSSLFQILKERHSVYTSMEGRDSIESILRMPDRAHLIHNLMMDNQRVIQLFFKRLSCDPTVIGTLGSGEPLRADNTIDLVVSQVRAIYSAQNLLFTTHSHTHYSIANPTYQRMLATPKLDTEDVTPAKRSSDSSNNSGNSKDRSKKKSGNGNGNQVKSTNQNKPTDDGKQDLSDEEILKRKEQGYLVKLGNAKHRQKIRHEFSKATTPNKWPCNGHMYKGVFCSRKKCNAYHLPLAWESLPAADQKAMCQFVNDHSDTVAWAPGKTPALCKPFDIYTTLSPMGASPADVISRNLSHLTIAKPKQSTTQDPDDGNPTTGDTAFYPTPPAAVTPTKGILPAVSIPSPDPFLSENPPKFFTENDLNTFAETLPECVKGPLNNKYGKTHTNISFTGEIRFRHIIPHLVNSYFLDTESNRHLDQASFLARQYRHILGEYDGTDTANIRGYTMYKHSTSETTLNRDRITLSSAALINHGCNIEKLVRYIAGPHLATHRNVPRIMRKLRHSCTRDQRVELKRTFVYGAPKFIRAQNTEENLLKFYRYGNHSTVDKNPEIFHKVLVKDSRRGNVIVLDDRLFPYIPNTHLTPQGLADLDNQWKKPRTIFDSSFLPDVASRAINNDWTTKHTEPKVTYQGSFLRFCQWLYNLRISYPNRPIFLGDDDVTNAFRLIKTNPCAVGMHMYRFGGHTVVATGQTFGDSFSPANFEPAAICRQHHARWLWIHKPEEILQRAGSHVKNIELIVDPDDTRPFAAATKDKLNLGVFTAAGTRLPPSYPMQVDDCLYADVAEHFPRTVAASVTALEDVFDGHHPYQDPPLSLEKLNPIHKEQRLLLGHLPDTRTMVVKISPRRATKILEYLETTGWLNRDHAATIREIAMVTGLIDSACEFFPWGRAQLLIVYELLRHTVTRSYAILKTLDRIHKRVQAAERIMPADLKRRLQFLQATYMAKELWNNKVRIPITEDIRKSLLIIYKYLKTRQPWEQPIGHIVPRVPEFISTSDASHTAIGVEVKRIRAWCLIPYSRQLASRIKAGEVHINALEFIGLLVSYIMVLERYKADPTKYGPHPVMCAKGDNTSANAWWRKMSTASPMGGNLVKLYAEYQLLAPVCSFTEHIKGVDNVVADAISRPDKLFRPPLTEIYTTPYPVLIRQVCQRYKHKKRWDLFLISAELQSQLSSLLCSNLVTERIKKPQNSGQFVPAESIFSNGAQRDTSTHYYSL